MLHKILERQLKRFFGSTQTPPKEWQEFLQAISDTYVHYDEDRVLIERSLDISSREHTEYVEALKRQTEVFESLADNTPDIIARFDRNLRHVYVNHQVELVTNLKVNDFIGKTNTDLGMDKEVVALWQKKITEAFETKQPVNFEYNFDAIQGKRTYECKIIPEKNSRGSEVETVLAINHDITDRKRTEDMIISEKQFLDTIIEAVGDPLFVKNEKHEWVLLNQAFATMLGKSPDVLLNKSDYEFLPKEQADLFWQKDEEVLNSGKENVNEEIITGADGKLHNLVTKKTRFIDKNNKKYIVGLILDITEQKEREKIIEDRSKDLELLNQTMIGRELKMVELKKEIKKLQEQLKSST